MTVPSEPPVPHQPGPRKRGRIRPRYVVSVIAVVLLVIFMLENQRSVPIRFIGPQVHAPLILALLISAVLGALATLAVQRLRRR